MRCPVALLAALAPCAPAFAQVRISQIHAGGGAVGSPCSHDYVELHNAGAPQDLSGWSIQYAAATGQSWSVTPLPAVILGSGEHLLVLQAEGTTLPFPQTAPPPPADVVGFTALAPGGGKVALCSSSAPLVGGQPSGGGIVDFVGYGAAASWREPFAGGTAADNAPAGGNELALFRTGCGASDSDRNAADFALGFPAPRSRALGASGGLAAGALCSPYSAKPGQSFRLVVAPFACDGSPLGLASVLADLTEIGGGAAVPIADDGLLPDEVAGDGLFTGVATVAPQIASGGKTLVLSLSDGARSGAAFATLAVRGSATPDADTCSRAQPIAGPFPSSVTGDFSAAGAEFNPVLHESSLVETMRERRGLWFSVVGTGRTMTADTCLSPLVGGTQIPDTVLMVLGGTCDGLTRIAFDDDQPSLCGAGSGTERRSRASWCSVAGETYFVWVAPYATGAQSLAYELRISDGAPCSGAVPVTVCALALAGAADEDEPAFGPATNDGCDAPAARYVELAPAWPATVLRGHARSWGASRDHDWFRFQAGASAVLDVELTSAAPALVELHELSGAGDCSGSALVATSQLSQRCSPLAFAAPLLAGHWYALRVAPRGSPAAGAVGGVSAGASSSAYRLSVSLGDPPPNDVCASALPLACGAQVQGTTWNAAPESGIPSSCPGPGGSVAQGGAGVWYRVQLPGSPGGGDRTVQIEASSASFDPRVSVFQGTCASLACVTANDDVDASGRAIVAWRATAGVPYSVLVSGAPGASGDFDLAVTCAVPPANDACAAAVPLDPGGGVLAGTTAGASGAPSSYPLGGAGGLAPCAPPLGSGLDVWYRFVAPCTTELAVDTCGAHDTVLSVHSACPDASNPYLVPGACSDDGAVGCAPGSALLVPVQSGASYLIRVARASAAAPGGPFTLSWSLRDGDGDGTPDCFDGCPLDPLKTAPGQCGCGAPDTDTDGDGVADCVDGCPFDPLKTAPGICGCGVSDVDSDGDGVADCLDGCPSDPLKTSPGLCGCGVSETDTDGDGAPDCIDLCPLDPGKIAPGQCGCGVPDVDSDGDGAADCVDGCPLDPLKTSPGACGCGVPDVDTDGDGVLDCVDVCPGHFDPAQRDCDQDGIGDVCAIATGISTDLDLDGAPDDCEPGLVLKYCTSVPTSAGCAAALSYQGRPSASAVASFVVRASSLDGQRSGIFFYGVTGPVSVPFGPGVLCVAPPRQRTGVQVSGGTPGACDGSLALDWNAYRAANPATLGAPFASGSMVWIQAWWRDPAAPGGTALSAALQFTHAP